MDAKKLWLWFARQGDAVQEQVMENILELRQTYFNDCRMRGATPEKDPKKELGFFVAGVKKSFKESSNRRLSTYDDLKAVEERRIEVLKAKGGRPAVKREKILEDLKPVIERLRAENISWAKVSDYIAKHHKKRVSRGYLQKLFKG